MLEEIRSRAVVKVVMCSRGAQPLRHRRRKGSLVGRHHGECGARAYNGGLGAEPPAGSRGRAPVRGSGWRSPPEAESILVIGCPTEPANLAHCDFWWNSTALAQQWAG